MYLIPEVKELAYTDGSCPLHQGVAVKELPEPILSLLSELQIPVSEHGIPLQVRYTDLRVPPSCHSRELLEEQAYRLSIDQNEILIEVKSPDGLYPALATLYQISTQYPKQPVPCLHIFDYPVVAYRGIMLDVSRAKIPNRKTFEELVKLSFQYKYNILQLYWEDCYLLSSHPLFGTLNGYYDREEVAWMEQLCREFGIELQANIQTFSHMHGILRIPGYEHLAENAYLFTLAPGKEAVYRLLDEILGEILPWFSSKTVHLNMDEAYDLGTGYSKPQVDQKGREHVYVEHIRRVADLARKHGAKKLLVWGDSLAKYPSMPEKLDKDIVFIDWNYNPETYYPSLEQFDGSTREFWVAPGTSSWNAIFPRVQNSQVNIKHYIAQGVAQKALGVLITHWGDYGHHQPFSFSNFGFIYGAEQAYNGGVTEQEAFESAFRKLVLKDDRLEQAVKFLAGTNELPAVQVGFKSQSLYSLFDDFFKGLSFTGNENYPAIPKETFEGFVRLGGEAAAVLTANSDDRPIATSPAIHPDELLLSAQMLVLAGEKGLLGYTIKQEFSRGEVTEHQILQWIYYIKILFREFSRIRQRFTELWEQEAVTTGREGSLYLFDKAATRYDQAVRYLASQRLRLLEGKRVETHMESYTAHEGYTTLWTMDCLNLWDRAYPWR